MPKTSTTNTIDGLRRVVDWLAEHPDLAVAEVDYASRDGVELSLHPGGYDVITAVANIADTLTATTITVADASPPDRARDCCQLLVTGWTASVNVTVAGICWITTAQHLRSLLPVGA
jgi:hypothetical protein